MTTRMMNKAAMARTLAAETGETFENLMAMSDGALDAMLWEYEDEPTPYRADVRAALDAFEAAGAPMDISDDELRCFDPAFDDPDGPMMDLGSMDWEHDAAHGDTPDAAWLADMRDSDPAPGAT